MDANQPQSFIRLLNALIDNADDDDYLFDLATQLLGIMEYPARYARDIIEQQLMDATDIVTVRLLVRAWAYANN